MLSSLLFFTTLQLNAQTIALGSVGDFVLFTVTGAVGNTGISPINGNIGTNVGAITGFGTSPVTGSVHTADSVTIKCSADLLAAYTQLNNITPTFTSHAPAYGSGETLFAGVYSIGAAGSVAAVLNLDAQGNPNAVFIFKFGGAFTTGASTVINLLNGAISCNVYWVAEGAIAMAASTNMKGTLIANNGAISMGAGGILDGRMFSTAGAVAVNGVSASLPACYLNADWKGVVSTDWNTQENWLYNNIPSTKTAVNINPSMPFSPTIYSGLYQIKKLSIKQNTILTISSGAVLSITDTLTNNGNLTSQGKIKLNGLSQQTIEGIGNISNLELFNNTGANISASSIQSLFGILTISSGTLTTNEGLILKSNALGTAIVAPILTGNILGNVTVERYISSLNNRAYRMLTPSVNTTTSINTNWQENKTNPNTYTNLPANQIAYGTHITGLAGSTNGFDATITNQSSLFLYNQTNASWDAVTNTSANMIANTGYLLFIRGNRDSLNVLQSANPSSNTTLRATGTLQKGNISFNGLSGNGNSSLVTNPYAAPILWDSITGIYATGIFISNHLCRQTTIKTT
jgi:hypothetical protein